MCNTNTLRVRSNFDVSCLLENAELLFRCILLGFQLSNRTFSLSFHPLWLHIRIVVLFHWIGIVIQ